VDELKGEVSVGKVNLETETAVKYRFRHKVRAHRVRSQTRARPQASEAWRDTRFYTRGFSLNPKS